MKKKILFIALAHSTHTISWVRLLDNSPYQVFTYGVAKTETDQLDNTISYKQYLKHRNRSRIFRIIKRVNKHTLNLKLFNDKGESDFLLSAIISIKPEIIHTLGFDPSGYEFLKVVDLCRRYYPFKWIHTSRGSELSLIGYLPQKLNESVISKCDGFISDSDLHYSIAIRLGLDKRKIPFFGFVPGTGGILIEELRNNALFPVSERERIILWPKAYECMFSKALPVFEALIIAWEKIKPCKIIMTAMNAESKIWFNRLPTEIRESTVMYDRIPRKELLQLMKESRVFLAPSLSDGIPNSLYEAMAAGTVPLMSPIASFSQIFINKKNLLFARNLYPIEISEALIILMNDDQLVDEISDNNYSMVKKMADRHVIRENIILFYNNLTEMYK